jgi:hypothetical protein
MRDEQKMRPPLMLERLLTALLTERDLESVPGDLEEIYVERSSTSGIFAANWWYAMQAVSLAPRAAAQAYKRAPVLALLCCFTAASGSWLGTMDIVLKHHDLLRHEEIAAGIVGEALLILLALPLRRLTWLRWLALTGSLVIAKMGASALWGTLHSRDTEGYILLIAAALLAETVMAWWKLALAPTR